MRKHRGLAMANPSLWDQLRNAAKLIGLSDWWKLDDTVIHQIVFDETGDMARADMWMHTAQYQRNKHDEPTR